MPAAGLGATTAPAAGGRSLAAERLALLAGIAILLALLFWTGRSLGDFAILEPAAAGAQTHRLDSAWRAPGPWPGSGPGATGTRVALPDVWRRQSPKLDGLHHYRFELPPTTWPGPSALYIPRLGNRARLWLDGQELLSLGDLRSGTQDYSPRPLLVRIPPREAGAHGPSELVLELAGNPARFSGLSALWWGPAEPLEAAWQRRDALLLAGAGLAGGGSLLLGAMGLAMAAWRRNPLLLWFGLAGLAAGTRALLWMWREPALPHLAWYAAMDLCFGLWACSIAWFALRAVELRRPWFERALVALMTVMLPATLAAALGWSTRPKELWLDATLVVAGLITLALVLRAWRRPDATAAAMALGAVTVVTLSGMDHWNIFFSTAPDAYVRPYFSHHMALLFSLFMAAALASRFDAAVRAQAGMRDSLAQQVQAQREELQALHRRERAQAEEQAMLRERQRLLQDIHDGLGSHLTGLLTMARRGSVDAEAVEREVAEALDHLRLTVDSASITEATLTDVVAQMRFRLTPRLSRLGLGMQWQLDDVPGALGPQQAAQVQKIVLEALSNTLHHAQASVLTIATRVAAGHAELLIQDDGIGAWTGGSWPEGGGHGLASMRSRARALGAEARLDSPPAGGTRIVLRWPGTVVTSAAPPGPAAEG